MFWNKKDKYITMKEITDILVTHAANTGKLHETKLNRRFDILKDALMEHIDDVTKLKSRCMKLEETIKALCPCNNLTMKKNLILVDSMTTFNLECEHEVVKGKLYHVFYEKECDICGNIKNITKKQYLTYQKETIELSLKELG